MTLKLTSGLLAVLLPWAANAGFFDQSRGNQETFLPADQAFIVDALAIDAHTVQARWNIAPGYYLYRHRLDVSVVEPSTSTVQWQPPNGEPYEDEHFGEVEIYHDVLDLPIAVTGDADSVTLKLRYQGCADAGLCYPPQTYTVKLNLNAP